MIKALTLFTALFALSLSCSAQKKNRLKNAPAETPVLDTIMLTGTLFITNSSTPFREKPHIDSSKLKEIPSYVVLKSFRKIGNYYEVVLNDTTGYIPIGFVNKYIPAPAVDYSSPGNSSSSSSSYNSSSNGCSSRQCSGTTKKGARCRNTTSNCSGRCYLH